MPVEYPLDSGLASGANLTVPRQLKTATLTPRYNAVAVVVVVGVVVIVVVVAGH